MITGQPTEGDDLTNFDMYHLYLFLTATSELAPSLLSQSYLQLPPPEGVSTFTTMELVVYPRSSEGLLIYAAQAISEEEEAEGDFVALGLKDGRVLLQLNLGTSVYKRLDVSLCQLLWKLLGVY